MNKELKSIVSERTLVQTLGSGGVGKTTLSVVIGIAAAKIGKKTLVITIDPSKRLMDTLHLKSKDEISYVKELGINAMMIDVAKSWETILKKYSSDKVYNKIIKNRFNNYLKDYFPGFDEYIASEMIYYMLNVEDYDFIVVDSPPSTYAISYLEASHRILDVLSNEFILSLIPYINMSSAPIKIIMKKEIFILKNIARFTGMEMLTELVRFVNDLSPLLQGFRQRADFVKKFYGSSKSGFIVVTLPYDISLGEANILIKYINELKYNLDGIFFNRLCSFCGDSIPCSIQIIKDESIERDIEAIKDQRLKELIKNHFVNHFKAKREVLKNINDFMKGFSGETNIFASPEMPGYIKSINDIIDIFNGLKTLNRK